MEEEELLKRLNAYPMWEPLDGRNRAEVYRLIFELGDVFRFATSGERKRITDSLGRPAKYLMYQYSREKAVEGIRRGSKKAIVEGLIPVVMAGGRSDNATGGSLFSMLLHSAERSALDAVALFQYAAQFAPDEESGRQIHEFPMLSPEMRSIERFGFRERKTSDGVTYEHMVEAMSRPRWWDKLTGQQRVTMGETIDKLRSLEETFNSGKKH